MASVTLANATDLASWADRRDAQERLPQLVRRLVHATVLRIVRIGFPADESIALGGWDGIVTVEGGNAFVSNGTSAWELSTNKDVAAKAEGDYGKRCKDPRGIDPAQSTFIFVTPRRWPAKSDWMARHQSEGLWREVRAYDADDLCQWLELAPVVHTWLSVALGKHPEGAMDIGSFWVDWSEVTRPAITPELLLAGRQDVAKRVHVWLRSPSPSLALRCESRDEALAVFAAALHQLPPEERVAYLSRAVVVHDISAWYRLAGLDEPLVMVPLCDSKDAIPRATRKGHRVLVPLGLADSATATTVTVPRLSRDEAAKALIACQVPDEQARELATQARRSLASFRRQFGHQPRSAAAAMGATHRGSPPTPDHARRGLERCDGT